MKRSKRFLYDIDLSYELKTYKKIGTDYQKTKSSDKKGILNFIFSKCGNREKSKAKYKPCHTYTGWEKHAKGVLRKDILNYKDLLHWLYWQRDQAESMLVSEKTIVIPIYIVCFEIFDFMLEGETLFVRTATTVTMIITVACFSFGLIRASMEKVRFYKDFIGIAETYFTRNEKS